MSTESKNKEFLTEYTEDFWNHANIGAFDTYYAPEFVSHHADGDKGRSEYLGLCQAYFSAFPDLKIVTDGLVAEGDRVTKIWTAHCTHRGDFLGIPASGNRMTVKGIEVFRIRDRKIVELWVSMDILGMMQQMGAIPAPAAT